MAKKVFYASKVNVHANIFSQNLNDIIEIHIPRAILSAPSLKKGSYNWSITDVNKVLVEGSELITGNLTKSRYASMKKRDGMNTKDIVTDFEVAHTSRFFYHPVSEIIVHEFSSYINEEDFISIFQQLIGRDVYIGEIKVILIPEPHKIRSELKSIQKVTSIHFHLIHPNPGKKEFDLYNNLINQHDLKELDLCMANRDGMKISDKNDPDHLTDAIESGIQLVETGYGGVDIKGFDEVKVKGKRKDKIVREQRAFLSRKSIRKITVNEFGEEVLLSRIRSFILDVKDKVVNKGDEDDTNIKF
ncbi:hypothetical protein [Gorillibacterium timonense]|uniref:hypothetical protein n=1 Tax=Gorillibacterium timonense TaxID=1689269 RepID=UPI00071CF625|nr:hypothetical protein [Gorillibacterium timonense]